MKRLFLGIALLLICSSALADERILSFDSEITVFSDGSMQVTESITVRAEGDQIRRGIYRDFPTDYRDRFGNRYRVDFDVIDVRRDGTPEAFHSVRQGDGTRVYIGRKEMFLEPGEYRYVLTYRTSRQLGFFDDHDELYWNVTGNDWIFPIDAVSATVALPADVPASDIGAEAYTGVRGAVGQDYRVDREMNGNVRFTGSRPFAPGEGLTIVVTWPKGVVMPPSTEQQVSDLFRDNRAWVAAVIGLVLVLLYYLAAWYRVGRDPESGVVIVRYAPPPGISPGSARFIERMGYDHKAFAAAVVNLAVKGLVDILEEGGDYVLKRTKKPAGDLAAGEKVLLKTLFGSIDHSDGKRQALDRKYHAKIRRTLKAHEESLRNDYEKRFFTTNRGWLIPGILLSVVFLGITLVAIGDPERMAVGAFLTLWLSGWSVGVVILGLRVVNAWRGSRSAGTMIGALTLTAFAVPFFGAEVAVLGVLATQASPALPFLAVSVIVLNLLFYQLLKAPTRAGRRLLDRIEGFRMFLDVAEKDEMNLRNPPDRTPELFERFLPYALALDVEQQWMERFARVFADLPDGGEGYRPSWYHGSGWSLHHPAAFAGGLGESLGAAVAASSTAPGSSSGSVGGGSSGGGGGGGGGGGW